MARSSWEAAINFGGFPIHVRAFKLVESASAQSFKNLCSCHQQPVTMPKMCAVDQRPLEQADLIKGVEIGRGDVRVLSDEAVESIQESERTESVDILALPPRASVPVHFATNHFRVVPNEKVPGSEGPVGILWNGLLASERAIVTEIVQRAGSRQKLTVITADAHGLTAVFVPYTTEFQEVPEHQFAANEQAAQMFEVFAQQQGVSMDDFAHASFEDAYGKRRKAAVEAALAGKPVERKAGAEKKPDVGDLMAAMSAAMGTAQAPAKKTPAKRKTAAKTKS